MKRFILNLFKPIVRYWLIGLTVAMLPVAVIAHAPDGQFDTTRFADPTDENAGFKLKVDIISSVENDNPNKRMISPLRTIPHPKHHNILYVVDQVGKLWMINLKNNKRKLVFDFTSDHDALPANDLPKNKLMPIVFG